MSDKMYKGVVTNTYEKDWTDRDSGENIVLRSFKIEGESRYFRTGTNNSSAIAEGNYISFSANTQSGTVDLKSVEIVEGEAPARAPKPSASTAGKPKSARSAASGGRDTYWADKAARDVEVTEPRISYSAAQKNATALVAAALAADALSFGSTAKGKRLDMMVDFVELTTLRLAKLQMNAPALLKEDSDGE